MKNLYSNTNHYILIVFQIIIITIIIVRLCYVSHDVIAAPRVDLPEEWRSITKSDTLQGYIDNNGTLHIEFKH